MTGLDWLTCDDFAPCVGDRFDVMAGGGAAVPLVLSEASESTEPGGRGPAGQERLQFSLLFGGPPSPMLPQGTYRVSHTELGELDLFLVPIGRDDEGVRYEAAFA